MQLILSFLPRLLYFVALLFGGATATNVVGMANGSSMFDGWNIGLTLTTLLGTLGSFFTGWKLAPINRAAVLKAIDTLNGFVDRFLKDVGQPDDGLKQMVLQALYRLLQRLHEGDKVAMSHVSALASRNVVQCLGCPAPSPDEEGDEEEA